MSANGYLQLAFYVAVLIALAKPLGAYMARIYADEPAVLNRVGAPFERLIYRLCGVDSSKEMGWTEYTGALLSYLDPKSTAATPEAVSSELATKLPSGIGMLTPSPAEDKDVVAVTQATADKYQLKTISDLKPVAGELVLGGPPEWKTRTQGVAGLRDVYGLNFKDFISLDAGGTLTMTALTNGQIQAGDLFSTDPGLHANHLVALEDDKNLFAAENVVPLIKSAKQNDQIKKTLDAVSAKLTTDDLITMNADAANGTNLADIAKKWLANAGISSK